nr:cupredoxin domain-containing protein [Streptomyces lienomycini]
MGRQSVANDDTTTHTLTAAEDNAFDTGDIAPGRSATFTAPSKPGDFPYDCTIHPFMKGTLTVG